MARRLVVLLVVLFAAPAWAASPLIVGTKPSPPFSIKNDDGSWTGISIELWRRVAVDLGVTFELREFDSKGLLDAVEHKQVDVGVAATTITAEREQVMDFTHPIFSTGLGVAVLPRPAAGGAFGMLRALASWELAKLLGALFVLLVAIGALVWVFERRRNSAQFGGGPVRGIAAGVWWSAVTMTTVGYGDKAPVTTAGRTLGLVWMFAAIILISSFTASITSALTVRQLESSITSADDLARVRVATTGSSTSATYLDHHHIAYATYPTLVAAMHAVVAGQVDAVVYDAPILQYLARHDLGGAVIVLPFTFERQDYGFALPDGSALREPLNRAILAELDKDTWRELLEHYLGQQ